MTWINYYGAAETFTYPCSGTQTYYGESIIHVSNGCGGRVWLHGTTTGGGAAYCVNPGALAYGFTTIYEQILVSANTAACDAGIQVQTLWSSGTEGNTTQVSCVDGAKQTDIGGSGAYYLGVIYFVNKCNTRIWILQNPDGSGNALCVGPGVTYDITKSPWYNWNSGNPGTEIAISGNQASCSAG